MGARIALAALAVLVAAAPAQAAPSFEPVPGSYTAPIYLTAPPGDTTRLFVVERGGRVEVVHNWTALEEPFIEYEPEELTTDVERGLLSLAFAPDYETSGLAYTYLTGPGGELQIREHRRSAADPNRTEPGSRLVWSHPHPEPTHNGGTIQFGPDGMLWLAPGDGGGVNDPEDNARDLGSRLGKVLRIDPRQAGDQPFTVPEDNPYAAPDDGIPDEIWASGLRNPFRFSFDRGTGDLVIGDVGQGAREEIDHVRFADGLMPGADFGWRCYEGSIRTADVEPCEPRDPYVAPAYDYPRTEGRTVTGGVVVRSPGLPALAGRYVYADFFSFEIRSLDLAAPEEGYRPTGHSGPAANFVAAFGEDACGDVYAVSLKGPVNRLADTDAPGCMPKPALDPGDDDPPGGDPPGPGDPGPGVGVPDARAPGLGVGVRGRRSLASMRRLRVAVRSDEPAAVAISGRIRGIAPFRTARRDVAAGQRTVLPVRISRKAARRLRGTLRRKRVIVALWVRGRDAAGNESLVARRIVVRRR